MFGGSAYQRHILHQFTIGRVIPVDQRAGPHYRCQDVVEFIRHPARQGGHGIRFFRRRDMFSASFFHGLCLVRGQESGLLTSLNPGPRPLELLELVIQMIRTGLSKLQVNAAAGGALCLRLRSSAFGVGDLNLVNRFAGGGCGTIPS